MSQTATLTWFARHELNLIWRDWVSIMTAGKRRREPLVAFGLVVLAVVAHLFAYHFIGRFFDPASGTELRAGRVVFVTFCGFLSWTLMMSQAMEHVTRAFYARDDLELILSSPASSRRVFAIRIGVIGITTTVLSLLLAVPFVNTLVVLDGPRWLATYGVLLAMGAFSAACAVALTIALFRTLGPKRTRLVAQIVAAVVGSGFVIGIQAVAIMSAGTFSRFEFMQSELFLATLPQIDSYFWWPARAAMGDLTALVAVASIGAACLLAAIVIFSTRFGEHVIAASGVAFDAKVSRRGAAGFRPTSPRRALRRKEWTLLWRDPWLVSQSLMQVLYLLPPALLLWRNFGSDVGTLLVMVPVLVMASGQLAGGLAWLAVSGEDAPDLIGTAPVTWLSAILAKVEAVLLAMAMITAPLLIGFALAAPMLAFWAAITIAAASVSATMIQIWFRAQARRSAFRRRQTSSRVATFAEAFSSVLWAATAGMAAAGSGFAVLAAFLAVMVLAFVHLIRPYPEER